MSGLAGRALPATRRATDATIVGLLLAGGIVETTVGRHARGPWWANLLCVIAMTGPLWWRRRLPEVSLAAFLAGALVSSAWLTRVNDPATWVAALIVLGFSLGRHGSPRQLWGGGALAVAGVGAVGLVLPGETASNVLFPLVVMGASGIAGYALHERAEQGRLLAERTHELEGEREARSRAAVVDERRRIARELHDVVAHNVSVMVVQAGAARRTLDRDPAGALDALGAVEATGRGALVELRRLLGLLRPEGEGAARAPQPGLGGLDELLERTRSAGLPVELVVEGTPATLPSGVDLAAYRVVQEALTNTLKHAGPARARVLVRWTDKEVELEVTDTGRGRGIDKAEPEVAGHFSPRVQPPGQGLLGMRERVAMYGGEMRAGRGASGGFEVHVRLPRERRATEAAA